MKIKLLPSTFAITKMEPDSTIPSWISASSFVSITRTKDELSITCEEKLVPEHLKSERNWKVFGVLGPLDFSLTGILSELSQPLAEAQISIFAVSTYDTDYILVKSDTVNMVKNIWEKRGHEIVI